LGHGIRVDEKVAAVGGAALRVLEYVVVVEGLVETGVG